jgi:hypothetical protein
MEFLCRIAIESEQEGNHEQKLIIFLKGIYENSGLDSRVIVPEYDD